MEGCFQALSVISQLLIAGASVSLAIVAWKGLNAWKHPIGYKAKLQNIDDLIESMTELKITLSGLTGYLIIMRYMIGSNNEEFVNFIDTQGKDQADELNRQLIKIRPIESRIKTLLIKTQILGIGDFEKGSAAYINLTGLTLQINGLAGLLSFSDSNWDTSFGQQNLDQYRVIIKANHQETLDENYDAFISFASNAQKALMDG